MKTETKSASVKVMLSYDYCHFEISMSLENDSEIQTSEINEARKSCQRLADEAVRQYKKAKEMAMLRSDGQYKIQNFKDTCEKIRKKSEGDRTISEIAMLKQYENENWQAMFDYEYNYED